MLVQHFLSVLLDSVLPEFGFVMQFLHLKDEGERGVLYRTNKHGH